MALYLQFEVRGKWLAGSVISGVVATVGLNCGLFALEPVTQESNSFVFAREIKLGIMSDHLVAEILLSRGKSTRIGGGSSDVLAL
jgi:hypothetical protein